ncbi:MAG TPA: hypothetical protein DEE98_02040 [Elusimicrobia bacterium]|nr:MAG: hypothetical protein A2278_05840 [Elusimicrobia bacterium RIFOXYA12_FULL_49_49]OGS07779.1 MAG: hypothetical protein A2204_02985 [Elusimicrobia bacterium RIFOXYA1_FULL_47_7]OGS09582.1 MAG: hypothetical protein A2386_07475 [Elusimicrobia bacterium RIFOXYB1_FULL_48_9]OGS15429.1 MAG: hypothetical protein A2251_07670 [Elusimicrobia bacterium RIFOXYA2_FULL_47_53]OGS30857.1 MAG: hypothetical protein A2323_00810 [Elusimicrobia bacterium RIFOXYB2_FULL_46_23]HBU69144.1 hypothetical protein [Elus
MKKTFLVIAVIILSQLSVKCYEGNKPFDTQIQKLENRVTEIEIKVKWQKVKQVGIERKILEKLHDPAPFIRLWVDDEGTLNRDVLDEDIINHSISWVIVDAKTDAHRLTRNAATSTQFRFPSPGKYKAYMSCYFGDGYKRISDIVTFKIP